jgi:hypothetical protein
MRLNRIVKFKNIKGSVLLPYFMCIVHACTYSHGLAFGEAKNNLGAEFEDVMNPRLDQGGGRVKNLLFLKQLQKTLAV